MELIPVGAAQEVEASMRLFDHLPDRVNPF
jgi:hypothetical protein